MARYTIEDIISAVQAGEVTEQQAAGDLSRLGKYQESSQSSKETKLKMKLTFVDLSIASNKNNPEAVLLERERLTELLELWQRMETALTARQLEILKAYLQCGKNTMAAARSLGISQPVIFKTIKSVRQKLQNRFGIRLKAFKEILLLPQIAQEAQKALGVGQPFEQEMKLWLSAVHGRPDSGERFLRHKLPVICPNICIIPTRIQFVHFAAKNAAAARCVPKDRCCSPGKKTGSNRSLLPTE